MAAGRGGGREGRGGRAGGAGRGGGRAGGAGRGAGAAAEPDVVVDDQGWWVCPHCGDRRRDSLPRHLAQHQYKMAQDAERRRRQIQERQDYERAHQSPRKPWKRR